MENGIPTKYCEACGKEMLFEIVRKGFDRNTGIEIKGIRYICPVIKDEINLPRVECWYKGHSIYFQ